MHAIKMAFIHFIYLNNLKLIIKIICSVLFYVKMQMMVLVLYRKSIK